MEEVLTFRENSKIGFTHQKKKEYESLSTISNTSDYFSKENISVQSVKADVFGQVFSSKCEFTYDLKPVNSFTSNIEPGSKILKCHHDCKADPCNQISIRRALGAKVSDYRDQEAWDAVYEQQSIRKSISSFNQVMISLSMSILFKFLTLSLLSA